MCALIPLYPKSLQFLFDEQMTECLTKFTAGHSENSDGDVSPRQVTGWHSNVSPQLCELSEYDAVKLTHARTLTKLHLRSCKRQKQTSTSTSPPKLSDSLGQPPAPWLASSAPVCVHTDRSQWLFYDQWLK